MSKYLDQIIKKIIQFRNQRDWEQYHDPKNLAEAISIESGELLENFLWKTVKESRSLKGKKLDNIKEEIADIFIFLVYLCKSLDIDPLKEVEQKIEINRKKYPVKKAKGSNKKYTEL